MSATPSLPDLVSPAELAPWTRHACVRVVDASWYRASEGRSARDEFLGAHLPRARFFDIDEASDAGSALPHMLPADDEFSAFCARLGIGGDTHVVVYDATGDNTGAGRAWWQFRAFGHRRVSLLDGGLGRWRVEGFPLETGPGIHRPPAGRLEARLDRSLVRTLDDVRAGLVDPRFQLLDARSTGRFEGTEPEPRPGLRSGHVPGARSLPWNDLVDAGGRMRGRAELRARIERAGIDVSRPVVVMCGSGVSACSLILAFRFLGLPEPALYDGSWSEWGRPGDTPVETGPARP